MNKKLAVLGSSVVVIIVLGVGLAWWLGLFDEPEAEVSLAESAALVGGGATTTTSADQSVTTSTATESSANETTTQPAPPEAEPIVDLSGSWQVVPSDATFVGYRVNEVLGGVGNFTAVGRTAAVTGELVGSGLTIESVSIVADLTLLASDNGGRDAQMRRQGLETDTFPEATFVLSEPIVLDVLPVDGETIAVTATGDLTLHGVTNSIQVALEGQIIGGQFLVIGSTDIAMADYAIEPPKAPVVASVEEVGVMEFSLVFARA